MCLRVGAVQAATSFIGPSRMLLSPWQSAGRVESCTGLRAGPDQPLQRPERGGAAHRVDRMQSPGSGKSDNSSDELGMACVSWLRQLDWTAARHPLAPEPAGQFTTGPPRRAVGRQCPTSRHSKARSAADLVYERAAEGGEVQKAVNVRKWVVCYTTGPIARMVGGQAWPGRVPLRQWPRA
jgi:hypothetical protein